MSEVGSYPNATGPLSGTERLLGDQSGITVNITPNQIVPLGSKSLGLKSTFTRSVATAPLVLNYQFGSSVADAPGVIPIRNLTDLAANFNAFEDFTNLTTINSEIERYQPFNSTNHAFNANNLMLQAVNPNSDWQCTAITQGSAFTANVATPIAALGLANTNNIVVGQMAAVQGGGGVGGNYVITAIVANTSVTLANLNGSTANQTSTGLIFWLPVYSGTLASPTNVGTNTLNFNSIPTPVTNGMQIGWYNTPINGTTLNRDQDYRITNIAGNLVTFSPVLGPVGNLGAGVRVWFLPVVTSGQIWSKLQIDLTNPNNFFAIEADLTLLGPIGTTRTAIGANGQLTLAQFNGIPNTVPFGAWPAFWMYMADDGNSATETGSNSEIDFMEIQIGCTQDCTYLNTGQVGATGSTANLFVKADSGWGNFAAFGIAIAPAGTTFVGRNLYQMVFTNAATYRFFNGVMYKAQQFNWTGQRPAQFSVGLATGGLTAPLTANTIFPNNSAGFSQMQVAINGIKVWYQAAS